MFGSAALATTLTILLGRLAAATAMWSRSRCSRGRGSGWGIVDSEFEFGMANRTFPGVDAARERVLGLESVWI